MGLLIGLRHGAKELDDFAFSLVAFFASAPILSPLFFPANLTPRSPHLHPSIPTGGKLPTLHSYAMACPITVSKFVGTVSLGLLTVSPSLLISARSHPDTPAIASQPTIHANSCRTNRVSPTQLPPSPSPPSSFSQPLPLLPAVSMKSSDSIANILSTYPA